MFFGTVKWFNTKRGYGFIIPDEGGQDVFVHVSALHKIGLQSLEERTRIGYTLSHSNGKIVADNLEPVEGVDNERPVVESAQEMLFA